MQFATRKSTWRTAAMVLAAVMLMLTLAACGSKKDNNGNNGAAEEDKTEIATYKGGNVTASEFDKYLGVFTIVQPTYAQIVEIPQFKEQLLTQYISYKAIGDVASADAKKQAEKDVKAQMDDYTAALKDANNSALKEAIEAKNLKDADIENYFRLTATVVAHMNSLVTEDEMKKELTDKPADYMTATVRHILVATSEQDQTTGESKELRTAEEALARAKEAQAKLEAGGDWAALAKEYSDDPGSKETGGQYSDVVGGNWAEEFKQAAYTQEVGKIGEPVETEFGYHVILVEKRTVPVYDKLTDKEKEGIKGAVAYAHMNTYMTDEIAKLEIDIKLPEPSASPDASEAPEASDTPASDAPAATDTPKAE
jgi:foldase protein PrsA